jgi:cytochrome c biogenesis protein CcdA
MDLWYGAGKPTRLNRRTRFMVLALLVVVVLTRESEALAAANAPARVVYFTSATCPHCTAVVDTVLVPLMIEHGERLEIKVVDIADEAAPGGISAASYELLLNAEQLYGVGPEEQGLPMVVVGGEVLIGEDAIRERLPCLVGDCLADGGAAWPEIPGLDRVPVGLEAQAQGAALDFDLPREASETCAEEDASVCAVPPTIWIAYFYEVGCQECSRAEYDLRYVADVHPQVVVEEYNVQDDATLAEWLGETSGMPEDLRLTTPVLFIGDDYLAGAGITSEALSALVETYAAKGAGRSWDEFDAGAARRSIVERFESFGPLTVASAGLVDGLNPCAFATLAFFVSYLALSGRKGAQILFVGAAFTLGVFLAYLGVGLGFYEVLDALGDLLTTAGRWVYGITGIFCAALAVLSLMDFLKARRGEIGDMRLNLPHALRMRINAVIRKGRRSRAFVAGSFVTGMAVSLLELACTGQVYLPTIIFVVSQPQLSGRAIGFLLLYNLLFVVPLVVVFALAYYGTGSKQLTRFLQQRAGVVKLCLAVLFAALAAWLIASTAIA